MRILQYYVTVRAFIYLYITSIKYGTEYNE